MRGLAKMTKHQNDVQPIRYKAGWRVPEWAREASVSRGTVYNLLTAKALDSVKLRGARIITTAPADYLSSLKS
jgi:hypothetical protein